MFYINQNHSIVYLYLYTVDCIIIYPYRLRENLRIHLDPIKHTKAFELCSRHNVRIYYTSICERIKCIEYDNINLAAFIHRIVGVGVFVGAG